MRRALLFALLLAACKKDDPLPPAGCSTPDFDVLIMALDGPLPADLVVRVAYGGGEIEEYRISDVLPPDILFCEPSDREGNPAGTGGQGGQAAARSGDSGEGGAGGLSDIEALRCTLWTDGPATLFVEPALYETPPTELSGKKGKCTVSAEIEIGPSDGGT